MRWTKEETELFKEKYPIFTLKELLLIFPGKTRLNFAYKAFNHGLKKNSQKRSNSSMKFLCQGSLESFYWMGFLLTDGHFKETLLSVTLSSLDRYHLDRLANRLNAKVYTYRNGNICRLTVTDTEFCPYLISKWDIKDRKTYNPPSELPDMSNNEFLCFLAGFLDGDGHIEKDGCGRVKIHESWKGIMDIMTSRASFTKPKLHTVTTSFGISKVVRAHFPRLTLIKVKEVLTKNNVPFLKRKWDRVKEE
jgi:hypothetical protein